MRTRALLRALGALLLTVPASAQWIEPSHVLQAIHGELEAGQLGYVVAALGDCDGDGVRDLAVGAPLHRAGGPSAGRVMVFSAASGALLFQRDGARGDQLGMSIAGAGDADGDGRADVVVGAPQSFRGAGHVLVLSGAGGAVLHVVEGLEPGDRFGAAVEFVGDVDGDGADDFLAGAPDHNLPRDASDPGVGAGSPDSIHDAGQVSLHSGRTARRLRTFDGSHHRGRFGIALDGRLDHRMPADERLLVVAEAGDRKRAHGVVHVLRGDPLGPAFRIEGDAISPDLGTKFVSIVGDVDADGMPDVYASDWRSKVSGDLSGLVVVHSGRTGERLLRLVGEKANDGFGTGDGRVGDVDGDGHDDLLVGAWLAGDAAEKGGRVQVISGATGQELRRWTGSEAGASLGFDTAGIGDVDGDGRLDFVLSAALADRPRRDPGGDLRPDVGAVYFVSGELCDPGEHPAPEPIDLPTMGEADALLKQRRFAEAAVAFERIALARPGEARAWFLLGLAHHYGGDYESALAAHLRAAQFPGIAPAATYNAACAHAHLGNVDEAFVLLERALEQGFDDLRYMEEDRDLVSLRDDPRWAELVSVEGVGAFLEDEAVVLLELVGEDPGSQFGWAVAGTGDADGDGVRDLLVSAPSYELGDERVGRVDLFSGADGRPLRHWTGTDCSGFGRSVTSLGDGGGDGVMDVAVGAPGIRGGVGRVHIYSGIDGRPLFTVEDGVVGDQFGRVLAPVGDFDGDGRADLAIGACGDGTSLADDGVVVVASGASGEELLRLDARSRGERFGSAVAGRFDDTERVLVVGAQDGGPDHCGRVYVFRDDDYSRPALVLDGDALGADLGRQDVRLFPDRDGDGMAELLLGAWRHAARGPRTGLVRLASGRDGSELLRVAGHGSGEGFGIGAAPAGDLDGDGDCDLVVGAWLNQEGSAGGGKVYALSGRTGRALATWTSTSLQARFGSDVAPAGDVDGDGVPDLLVGAPARSRHGGRPGRAFVLSGASARASEVEAMAAPDEAGGR